MAASHGAGIVQEVAAATAMPPEPSGNGHASQHSPTTNGYIANPSSTRRDGHAAAVEWRRSDFPDKITIPAGDMKVQFIGKVDNRAGVGIRVVFHEGRKNCPTAEEKDIVCKYIKGEDGERTGFTWNGQFGMWHPEIVRPGEDARNAAMTLTVAIRLDAESRVQELADALKHHQADAVGYSESASRAGQAANPFCLKDSPNSPVAQAD